MYIIARDNRVIINRAHRSLINYILYNVLTAIKCFLDFLNVMVRWCSSENSNYIKSIS